MIDGTRTTRLEFRRVKERKLKDKIQNSPGTTSLSVTEGLNIINLDKQNPNSAPPKIVTAAASLD